MAQSIRPIAWLTLFDADASRSLRERICATVRTAIRSGALRNGERLPPTRTLAHDLRVSRITAEAAYRQLESEGYVRRRVGDGTFVEVVITPQPPGPMRRARADWSHRGEQIVREGGHADPLTAR